MCMPLGPCWGSAGRPAFTTLDEIRRMVDINDALKEYPDKNAALEKIKAFVSENITHTEKWLADGLYKSDRCLARLMAEPEYLKEIRKFIREERAK